VRRFVGLEGGWQREEFGQKMPLAQTPLHARMVYFCIRSGKSLKFKFTEQGRALIAAKAKPAPQPEKKAPRRVWAQPGKLDVIQEGDIVRALCFPPFPCVALCACLLTHPHSDVVSSPAPPPPPFFLVSS
jgi:hypothetical protein